MKFDSKEALRKIEERQKEDARLLEKWSQSKEFVFPDELRKDMTLLETIRDTSALSKHIFSVIDRRIEEIKKLLEAP